MTSCSSRKKIYYSHEEAVRALVDARSRFEYNRGTGPVAVYRCEDCGNFHLTSQGQMNETLRQYLSSGQPDRNREADFWLSKLKKR